MTKHDETAMRLVMQAARAAGYEVRLAAEGFVGVIGPAKVCRLCEAFHGAIVAYLDSCETDASGPHPEGGA